MTKLVNGSVSIGSSSTTSGVTTAELEVVNARISAEIGARLLANKYKGVFLTEAALQLAYPDGTQRNDSAGEYVRIDGGLNSVVYSMIWDGTDSEWVLQEGATSEETEASILAKLIANPGIEAYTTAEQLRLATLVPVIIDDGETLLATNTSLYISKYIDGYWYDFRCIDGDPTVDPVTVDTTKWSLEHEGDELEWHNKVTGYARIGQTFTIPNAAGQKHKYDVKALLDTAAKRLINPSSVDGATYYWAYTGSPQGL